MNQLLELGSLLVVGFSGSDQRHHSGILRRLGAS